LKQEIIKTADGSDTLYVKDIDEHYHSTFGAIQESMHVFINAGLLTCDKTSLTVFEAGFGTGLNVWLTFLHSLKNGLKIRYSSIEKYPLSSELYESLNYPLCLDEKKDTFLRIHKASWNDEIKLSDNFSLHKFQSDLTNFDFSPIQDIDLIYFDAFSPEKQPELWDEAIFRSLYDHTSARGKLVTYCAKGSVRRSLIKAGFITERIPGPPGKREMLRATKLMY
jgi:tRNA U34 5-methylaminomethyl-2-thiouridine-forming methyltransferase MnmC